MKVCCVVEDRQTSALTIGTASQVTIGVSNRASGIFHKDSTAESDTSNPRPESQPNAMDSSLTTRWFKLIARHCTNGVNVPPYYYAQGSFTSTNKSATPHAIL